MKRIVSNKDNEIEKIKRINKIGGNIIKMTTKTLIKTEKKLILNNGRLINSKLGINLFSCYGAVGNGFRMEEPIDKRSGVSFVSLIQDVDSYVKLTFKEDISDGEELTLSYDISGLADGEYGSFTMAAISTYKTSFRFDSNGRHYHNLKKTNTDKAITAGFVMTGFDDIVRFANSAPHGFTISNIKLERGNIATSYSRHPSECI